MRVAHSKTSPITTLMTLTHVAVAPVESRTVEMAAVALVHARRQSAGRSVPRRISAEGHARRHVTRVVAGCQRVADRLVPGVSPS